MPEAPRRIIDEVEHAVAAIGLTERGKAAMGPGDRLALAPVEESALILNAIERGRRLGRNNLAALARLSHGSRGAEVSALQRAFGVGDSGVFDAATKKAITQLETERLDGKAAGGSFMRSERELRLNVFRAPPPSS